MSQVTNMNNTNIPKALQKLPEPAIALYNTVLQEQSQKHTESTAMKIAWGVVRNRFDEVDGRLVARSDAFKEIKLMSFNTTPAEEFVSRSKEGNLIHKYVLSDVLPDDEGKSPTSSLLEKFAAYIKAEQPEVDTNHELYNYVAEKHSANMEMVSRAMKMKKGIAKMIDAVVESGRLVVSVMFDKRYENFIDRIKGMSLEGAFTFNKLTKKWTDGTPLGATFATEGKPYNPRAVRVA